MSHQNTNFDEKTMAMQLLKAQEQLMQLMAQHQISSPNKELPQELQQLLDNQTHIVRMMWQGRTNRDDEATPTDEGSQESKGSTWIKPSACKTCGEIGHTSNECHDEWPHSAASKQEPHAGYDTQNYSTDLAICCLVPGHGRTIPTCPDRKSTRLNSSHITRSSMPSSA